MVRPKAQFPLIKHLVIRCTTGFLIPVADTPATPPTITITRCTQMCIAISQVRSLSDTRLTDSRSTTRSVVSMLIAQIPHSSFRATT